MRVSLTTKTPPSDYTDAQWQLDYYEIKSILREQKLKSEKVKTTQGFPIDVPQNGKTNQQYYYSFLIDTLSELRSGHKAYCYFVYQIVDLLRLDHNVHAKFFPDDGYFSLSL